MLGEPIERRNLQHSKWPSLEDVIKRVLLDFNRLFAEKVSGSPSSQMDFNACNPDESELRMQFSIISIMLLYS